MSDTILLRVMRYILSISFIVLAGKSLAIGNALDTVLPKQLESERPNQSIEIPTTEAAFPTSSEILAPALTGLTLLEWDGSNQADLGVVSEGLQINSGSLLAEDISVLKLYLQGQLGKALTLNQLNAVSQGLVKHLGDLGYPIVDVAVPAGQDVASGNVGLLLLLGRVSTISANGQNYFSEAEILRGTSAKQGEVIDSVQLARDLDWLSRNPSRNANLVLHRGEEPGQTSIEYKVTDRRPWTVYAGYKNVGMQLTGRDRILAGFTHNNLWGLSHQLSYQGTLSINDQLDSAGFKAQAINYLVPLDWQHELSFFAVEQSSKPTESASLFGMTAESQQFGVRYKIPIIGKQSLNSGLRQDIELGYDFKKSNNDLFFGGALVQDNITRVEQLSAKYSINRPDQWGATDASVSLIWSPGKSDRDASYDMQRFGATTDYIYAHATFDRYTRLSDQWGWSVELSGQWADSNLLASEQLGIGGHSTVRGYEEYALVGDKGLIVTNELHYLLQPKEFSYLVDLFAFYDYGIVGNVDLLTDEKSSHDISSIGLGLNFIMDDELSLELAYGHQLESALEGEEKDNRLHVSVVYQY
ncbi:MAG: ShlB/FhaC/HecB family hemolysin secretion/activation protein [Gammaproteobacteria bacterium]|nr:ShlB/FhaC/HecB family hemolysin secretion/activation protein [Gammaproteobacteria bacterium]